jgi:hypothetical protein
MVSINLSFAGHSIDSSVLPSNSLEHLLQLGFSTAIKNSIAGVKAGIMGNGANPWSDDDIANEAQRFGIPNARRDEETAAAICAAIQKEMFDSIVSGVARKGRASSPRLSDDDKLRQSVAIEMLSNIAKAKGKALPKRSKPDEKAAFDEMLAKALQNDKFAAAVEKEFLARKKKAAQSIDGLDDIF